MATLKPIRIGDTLERIYRRYNPLLDGDGNPVIDPGTRQVKPDYSSPLNLTGQTVKFAVENGRGNLHTFSGAKAVITPMTGTITVKLLPSDTEVFKEDPDNSSYLEFTDADGDEKTVAVRREQIVRKSAV
jgi:hypothetical protein